MRSQAIQTSSLNTFLPTLRLLTLKKESRSSDDRWFCEGRAGSRHCRGISDLRSRTLFAPSRTGAIVVQFFGGRYLQSSQGEHIIAKIMTERQVCHQRKKTITAYVITDMGNNGRREKVLFLLRVTRRVSSQPCTFTLFLIVSFVVL